MLTRQFGGRTFRKSSFSGSSGGNCVYLPDGGPLNAVADSKTGHVLHLDLRHLVQAAKRS